MCVEFLLLSGSNFTGKCIFLHSSPYLDFGSVA